MQFGHFGQQHRLALTEDVFKRRIQCGQCLQWASGFLQLAAHLRAQVLQRAFHLALVRRIKAAVGLKRGLHIDWLFPFGRGHLDAGEARARRCAQHDGLFQLNPHFLHMPTQGFRGHGGRPAQVGCGGDARWLRVQHRMQGNGLAKIQPIAQLLPDIVPRRCGVGELVFAEKTHQARAVEMGTRQGSRHSGWAVGSRKKKHSSTRGHWHKQLEKTGLQQAVILPAQRHETEAKNTQLVLGL